MGEQVRTAIEAMSHDQHPMPICTYNSTTDGIINGKCQQGHFIIYWCPGKKNLGNYVTNHHSGMHHKIMCPEYVIYIENINSFILDPQTCQGVLSHLGLRHKATYNSRSQLGLIYSGPMVPYRNQRANAH
eukprot:14955049-Ditylum_brightwellii.AAC.1